MLCTWVNLLRGSNDSRSQSPTSTTSRRLLAFKNNSMRTISENNRQLNGLNLSILIICFFDELLCSPFTIFHPPSLCQASTRPSKAVDFTVGWGPMGQSDQSDKPWENNGSSKVLQIWRASNWSHNVEGWCWSNPGLSRNTCPVGISKSWITTATTILLPN